MKKSTKRSMMTAVLPRLHILPGSSDADAPEYCLSSAMPVEAATGWSFTADTDPGDIPMREVHAFVQKALTDPKFSVLVSVAAAHIAASHALSDPWFRMDRYKTRIDEHVASIWELAQEVFEQNKDLAALYEGPRSPSRKAVGLERHGRKWASGDRRRAE